MSQDTRPEIISLMEKDKISTKNVFIEENGTKAKKAPQYIAALAVCLGCLSAGTVFGWTGNTSDDLLTGKFNNITIDDNSLGWIGSLANLGGILSCLFIGPLYDYFWRKWAMILLILPFTLGWLLIIFAHNVILIYLGRFMGGFAGCGFCISAPLYVSETSQKEIRGALATFSELFLTTGVLIGFILGYFLTAKMATVILATIPIFFGIVFLTQPETPYYLVKNNNDEAALKSLLQLRGKYYNCNGELKQIKAYIEEDKLNELPLFQSFKKKETKLAMFVSVGLMFFQQMCGVNAVIFYTSNIFRAAGIDEKVLDPEISTILVGVAQVVANIISVLAIDRLGRKTLLIISGLFMAIPELLLALYFTFQERNILSQSTLTTFGFVPIMCLMIFVMSVEVGYGPVAWIISVEVFPAEVKSILNSVSGAFNRFLSFLVTKFYLNMKNSIGGDVTFYIFGAISLCGAIFPIIFVPETKGKSLADIQKELRDGKNCFSTSSSKR